MDNIDRLRREIALRESELAELKAQLAASEQDLASGQKEWKWPLKPHEYQRYGRQMIVPSFGLQSQLRLRAAKVLIVGAGGLGCPASAYLAGSGVGVLGLVDGDVVEVSNLHRQIAHSTDRVGMSKVDSAIAYLRGLNPTVTYNAHKEPLSPQNAETIVSQYDLVLDCTDHPTSRYLISDICVLLGKPLVSASAFQTSGQLIVLNSPPGAGPCYRCVFPKPPPPESVVGCGEGGIVGPVVGVMGVLQALEAIKLIARGGLEHSAPEPTTQQMLIFSGMADSSPFRSVRMRGKRSGCASCSPAASITLDYLKTSMDYVQFCGVTKPVALLTSESRITAEQYDKVLRDGQDHLLVDVRPKELFSLASIPGSVNVPLSDFTRNTGLEEFLEEVRKDTKPVYMVCRVGNDSQVAAAKLKELGVDNAGARFIGDISGGLRSWKSTVDSSLPFL